MSDQPDPIGKALEAVDGLRRGLLRGSFADVIQFYVDRQKELQERHHSVQNELLRLEEWMDENDELLVMLRGDEKRMSEKGPYAEYTSAPEAIRAYLSQSASSQVDTIVEQLLRGGFPTSSANFKQVIRVALGRMKKSGEADTTKSGGWYLISAAEQEKDKVDH